MLEKFKNIKKICNAGNFLSVEYDKEVLKIQQQSTSYTYIKTKNIEDIFMYDNNNINIYTKTGGFIFINLKERMLISQL
ncbi:MAG: hypothetical protein PHQ88_07450 [Bacteroides sp.]|nr:hypothetical protein [Bacteroides sp.]